MKQSVLWITESYGGVYGDHQGHSKPIEVDGTDWRASRRREFDDQAMPHFEECLHAALHLVRHETDAQDLVIETFIRAYHAWQPFQSNSQCRPWLYRIMASAFAKRTDSADRQRETKNENDGDEYPVPSWLESRQTVDDFDRRLLSDVSGDDVSEAIRHLPEHLRLILVLSLLGGFSYSEIAGITGIPLDLIGYRLREGRYHLNENLRCRSLQRQSRAEGSWSQEKMNG